MVATTAFLDQCLNVVRLVGGESYLGSASRVFGCPLGAGKSLGVFCLDRAATANRIPIAGIAPARLLGDQLLVGRTVIGAQVQVGAVICGEIEDVVTRNRRVEIADHLRAVVVAVGVVGWYGDVA